MPFKPGNCANPTGRPRVPEIEQLRNALEKAKKENGNVSFLDHYCSLAYKDREVAKALANKILPDLSKVDSTDTVKFIMMPPIKVGGKPVEV